MAVTVFSATDMQQKIQGRIDSGGWWVIPVTDAEGFALVEEIASRYYQGDNSKLIEAVVIPSPIPKVSCIFLIMAAKQCMSPAQLGEFTCRDDLGAGSRDLIITPQMTASLLIWLYDLFRWPGAPTTQNRLASCPIA